VSGASLRREDPSETKLGVPTPKSSRRKKVPVEAQRQYVGVDRHRRRSVIVRKTAAGDPVETVQIVNDPLALAEVVARAGDAPEVVLEATYGWVRHEAPHDRAGCETPPVACRSRSLKLEAA